jgi:hypothetical protein
LSEVELDLLVLLKRVGAAGMSGGEVDEHVLALMPPTNSV